MSHYPCPDCNTPVLLSAGKCRQCGNEGPDNDATVVFSRPGRQHPAPASTLVLSLPDGSSFSVTDGDVVGRAGIGRDQLSAFTEVSRRHARFLTQDGRWFIVDLGAVNGTFLEGEKLPAQQPIPLDHGQTVGLSRGVCLTTAIEKTQLQQTTTTEEPVDPNRRTLVILFADIKGSVDFFQEHGTVVARNWIFKLFGMLTKIIEENGGTHLKNIGDAILAVFSDPHAAALAAIKMQRVVRAHNLLVDATDHYFLRIGMNKGSVLFENNDVFGNAVNIASRVQDLAPPECIYITATLHDKLTTDSQITMRPIGRKELKGVKKPTDIYEILVDAESDSAARR